MRFLTSTLIVIFLFSSASSAFAFEQNSIQSQFESIQENQHQLHAERTERMNAWFESKKAEQEQRFAPKREQFYEQLSETNQRIEETRSILEPAKVFLRDSMAWALDLAKSIQQYVASFSVNELLDRFSFFGLLSNDVDSKE